jgi:hypothetical protein
MAHLIPPGEAKKVFVYVKNVVSNSFQVFRGDFRKMFYDFVSH